jgi:uncharacterized membrane protein YdjX (TVP38/TMEM64 family)
LLVFLGVALVGLLIGHFTPLHHYFSMDHVAGVARRWGAWGPVAILILGFLSPLAFLPRWPLAMLSGLLYGVGWGTALANVASAGGAWLQFRLARNLLAPTAARFRAHSLLARLRVPPAQEFKVLFFLRVFPLSNFVATNLLAGSLNMRTRAFLTASFLGMIPSTLMYAAWGKLLKKPAGSYYLLAVAAVLLLVGTTLWARKHLWPRLRWRGEPRIYS